MRKTISVEAMEVHLNESNKDCAIGDEFWTIALYQRTKYIRGETGELPT